MTVENEPLKPKKKFLGPWRTALVAILVLSATAFIYGILPEDNPPPNFVWLAKFPRENAGLLTIAKLQLQRIPIVQRWFNKNQLNLLFDCRIGFANTNFLSHLVEFQQPFSTNGQGSLAWLLSPSNTTLLKKFIAESADTRIITQPQITTGQGMSCQISEQATFLTSQGRAQFIEMQGTGTNLNAANVPTNLVTRATWIELTGKLQGSRIKLTDRFIIESLHPEKPPYNDSVSSAAVENQGSLVLWLGKDQSGLSEETSDFPYIFLIIKPSVIDAKGKLVRLK